MAWGDPVRVRTAVHDRGTHVGYLTTVGYPDRDITAFSGGTPYFEIAVSDLQEKHITLLQRFRQHWLVHCGTSYDTADVAGELKARDTIKLAVFALRYRDQEPRVLVAALKSHIERILGADLR
ncbi:hypothetical protein VT84_00535 [Gemmata sp. SH-PL17]|nr:hypothetical protein VT84_00535 [Gemmata sp. SH-PL17]